MTNSYYTSSDAAALSFYKLPKALFTEEAYRSLSAEAKILYSFMMNRMELSIKNHWFDEKGRAYILFTLIEIMDLFGVSKQTATKRLDELQGVDLLDRECLGTGKPSKIYLKKLVLSAVGGSDPEDPCEEDLVEESSSAEDPENERVKNLDPVKSDEDTGLKNRPVRVKKLDPRKNEYRKTEKRKRSIDLERKADDGSKSDVSPKIQEPSVEYNTYFTKQLNIDGMIHDPAHAEDESLLHEIVNLCSEVASSCDRSPSVQIGRRTYSSVPLKDRFMNLTGKEVEYFLDCFHGSKCAESVRNPKAYILTSLYNATQTYSSYKALKAKRRGRQEVLPAWYYEDQSNPDSSETNDTPIDREALIAAMRAMD